MSEQSHNAIRRSRNGSAEIEQVGWYLGRVPTIPPNSEQFILEYFQPQQLGEEGFPSITTLNVGAQGLLPDAIQQFKLWKKEPAPSEEWSQIIIQSLSVDPVMMQVNVVGMLGNGNYVFQVEQGVMMSTERIGNQRSTGSFMVSN